MMNRQTLASMGVAATLKDRYFDMSRVIPFPDAAEIRREVGKHKAMMAKQGLNTLQGCTIKTNTKAGH